MSVYLQETDKDWIKDVKARLKSMNLPNKWLDCLLDAWGLQVYEDTGLDPGTNAEYHNILNNFHLHSRFFKPRPGGAQFPGISSPNKGLKPIPSLPLEDFSILVHELFHAWFDKCTWWYHWAWISFDVSDEEQLAYRVQQLVLSKGYLAADDSVVDNAELLKILRKQWGDYKKPHDDSLETRAPQISPVELRVGLAEGIGKTLLKMDIHPVPNEPYIYRFSVTNITTYPVVVNASFSTNFVSTLKSRPTLIAWDDLSWSLKPGETGAVDALLLRRNWADVEDMGQEGTANGYQPEEHGAKGPAQTNLIETAKRLGTAYRPAQIAIWRTSGGQKLVKASLLDAISRHASTAVDLSKTEIDALWAVSGFLSEASKLRTLGIRQSQNSRNLTHPVHSNEHTEEETRW